MGTDELLSNKGRVGLLDKDNGYTGLHHVGRRNNNTWRQTREVEASLALLKKDIDVVIEKGEDPKMPAAA